MKNILFQEYFKYKYLFKKKNGGLIIHVFKAKYIFKQEKSFDGGRQNKKEHLQYVVIVNSNTNCFSFAKELKLVDFPFWQVRVDIHQLLWCCLCWSK